VTGTSASEAIEPDVPGDRASPVDLLTIDLADPDNYTRSGGMELFEFLRVHEPVYWNRRPNGSGFWALTRYADAMTVFEHAADFTSERGMQVGQDEAAARAAAGRMLIVTDGHRHGQLRSLMNPLLAPAALRRIEPAMRAVVGDALERMAQRESFDFVGEVAARLPLSVICQLLDVPRPDWDLMIDWTRTAFGSATSDVVITDTEKAEANANIFAYYAGLVRERRHSDADDIVSALCRARIDGVPLTDAEILLNINGLITGGNETTRHASAGALIAFIENPGQWLRLREDPTLIHTAVEEVLRWTAPSLNVMRTALTAMTIAGKHIAPGDRVSIWNPAVNRDPAAFENPQRFDVGRHPNRHLTFGMGRHLCIGATVARYELSVLLREMAARVRHMELTGPIRRLRSNLMWGVDEVPVHLECGPPV
jgi:cytochrome P450